MPNEWPLIIPISTERLLFKPVIGQSIVDNEFACVNNEQYGNTNAEIFFCIKPVCER